MAGELPVDRRQRWRAARMGMIDRQERHPPTLKFPFGFVLSSRVGEEPARAAEVRQGEYLYHAACWIAAKHPDRLMREGRPHMGDDTGVGLAAKDELVFHPALVSNGGRTTSVRARA